MFRKSPPPTVPLLDDAPTTATDSGAKNGRSERTAHTWSRSSTREVLLRLTDVKAELERAALELALDVEARVLEGLHHRRARPALPRDESLDADLKRSRRELLQQPRPDAVTFKSSSATANAISAVVGSRSRT